MYLNCSEANEPNHSQVIHPSHLSQSLSDHPPHQFRGQYTLPSISTRGSQMPPIGTQTQTTVSYWYNSADLPHGNSGLHYPKNCFGVKKHRNLDEDDLRVVRWIY